MTVAKEHAITAYIWIIILILLGCFCTFGLYIPMHPDDIGAIDRLLGFAYLNYFQLCSYYLLCLFACLPFLSIKPIQFMVYNMFTYLEKKD